MTIRDAAVADADAIGHIRVAAWRATYAGIVPTAILERMDPDRFAGWIRKRIEGDATEITLVVEEGRPGSRRVAGYALAGPALDPDAAGLGEIQAIYLSPDDRGRGLGAPLLDAAVQRLGTAGYPAAVLWVLTDNQPARRFYERAAFALDGGARMLDFDGMPIEEVRYRRAIG